MLRVQMKDAFPSSLNPLVESLRKDVVSFLTLSRLLVIFSLAIHRLYVIDGSKLNDIFSVAEQSFFPRNNGGWKCPMRLTRVKVAPLLSARLTRPRAYGQKCVRHCFSKKQKRFLLLIRKCRRQFLCREIEAANGLSKCPDMFPLFFTREIRTW